MFWTQAFLAMDYGSWVARGRRRLLSTSSSSCIPTFLIRRASIVITSQIPRLNTPLTACAKPG